MSHPARKRPSVLIPAPVMVALALGAAVLAGCDDDDFTSHPTPTSTSAPTSTPTATAASTATSTTVPSNTATTVPTNSPLPTVSATATASPSPRDFVPLTIVSPPDGVLAHAQAVPVVLALDPDAPAELEVTIDGQPVAVTRSGGRAEAQVATAGGNHQLVATVDYGSGPQSVTTSFEAVELEAPDQCEILNAAGCLFPYPSARFLEPADTATGYRLRFPAEHMPAQRGRHFPIEPFLRLDGFSPTVTIFMHFPGGADPEKSNASRLLAATRTHDLRSLDADSPTILIDADSGERVMHFVEPEARAVRDGKPDREVLILHPAKSLTPGHRYLVAMRNLINHAGEPITAEPVFAAIRDRRPSVIPALEARRPQIEAVLSDLASHGIASNDLVLAFDFVVASDQSLSGEMLKMRDDTFAWLADHRQEQTFTVSDVQERDCSAPNARIWRIVQGTFQVPLYLSRDPLKDPNSPVTFNRDDADMPATNGFTDPPFTFAIPCTVKEEGGEPVYPIVLGHGLFGDGRGFVRELADTNAVSSFNYIAGATDWTGLAALDSGGGNNLPASFVGRVALDQPRYFAALPDRTRQGQLNTLVLARMMKSGAFNLDPAFQRADGTGIFPGEDTEEFYFGASLGGIMGLMFGALSPDVQHVHADVPGINFGFLLPRSIAFLPFEAAIKLTGVDDPIEQTALLALTHELWVRGESAGYATHITEDPLPGTNRKDVLLTGALYDQLVSNMATEIAARTLKLPSLVGSILPNRPGIPDVEGPVPGGLMFYDAAAFDPNNPAQIPFIPPLANVQPVINHCDPHGRQAFIPAAVDQLFEFLRPGGTVRNFCNGLCDAAEPYELPYNGTRPCDPLS